jgi:two-component system, NarL family, sensor histidine kinase DegS
VAVEQALQETVAELRALAAEVRLDLSSQEAELKELVIIIKQTQSEIDRLAPRKNESAKRLRDMEKNVEHFSRDDILSISEEASEAQMRTFAMESQLEQLEYKRKTADRARRNLLRFSALVEQLPELAAPKPAEEADEGHTTKEVIARVVRAEEDERQRNAAAIHEGATQQLTNLVLRAQLCQRLLESDPERGRQEFQELQTALSAALQESRRLIHDLRPLAIDDLGIFVSLRRYVQSLTDRGGSAQVELKINGPESRFEPWRELAIFRIAQEALSNAVRHARAKSVLVSIETTALSFRGVIEDDGVGFNAPAGANAARTRRQLGLAELYERITLVEGMIAIDSRMGRGTRVRFEVPLT